MTSLDHEAYTYSIKLSTANKNQLQPQLSRS